MPGVWKVGRTSDLARRMTDWAHCKFKPKFQFSFSTSLAVKTEKLCHVQLSEYQLTVACDQCKHSHRELFHAPLEDVQKVVKYWCSQFVWLKLSLSCAWFSLSRNVQWNLIITDSPHLYGRRYGEIHSHYPILILYICFKNFCVKQQLVQSPNFRKKWPWTEAPQNSWTTSSGFP